MKRMISQSPLETFARFGMKARTLFAICALVLLGLGFASGEISASEEATRPCQTGSDSARLSCQDSLIAAMAHRDSVLRGEGRHPESGGTEVKRARTAEADASVEAAEDAVATERTHSYFFNFMADWGDSGIDGGDWAKAIFIAAAVVAVGGTLIYLPVMIYKLARNQERDPVLHEIGLAYLYSGGNWSGGGETRYRNTHMPGLRYSALVAHRLVGVGLTVEGGYLAPGFEGSLDLAEQIDLNGAYALAGPILRFWPQNDFSLSFEFLNGTSTSASVGWVTKARINTQWKLGRNLFVGANAGSLFYDLHFFDGTVWREGDFNRDLAFTFGLETGYAF